MIILGILAIGSSIAWAVYSTTKAHFEAEQARQESRMCRNIAGHKVPCTKPKEKDIE